MSVSPLAKETFVSPNCGNFIGGILMEGRTHAIDKITVHHTAGVITVASLGRIFCDPKRQASANYGIDSSGDIACFVDESKRAWTSGNSENDNRAVTIEVSNDTYDDSWHVSDKAYSALLDLVTDVCRRNGIKKLVFTGDKTGNLTLHKYFQPTLCPGPYLESRMPELAKEVSSRLAYNETSTGTGGAEEGSGAFYRVQVGAYAYRKNAEKAEAKLKSDGFDCFVRKSGSLYKIQTGAFRIRTNAEALLERLKKAGYKGFITAS